ncbi:MAG: hypothetical protein DRI48_08085 [Chloroflexi bacterium]|nr:MAG: hypothetical protein DRI48_08085 [Chloroflexota bacterium]
MSANRGVEDPALDPSIERGGEADVTVVLEQIRAHLDLEAETEYELLEELRGHLEDAVAEARARGLSEREALVEVAARFGVEDVGRELQATHVGWGTADGVVAAALPVVCALLLRWLVFAPDGTAVGWRELLERPAFWVVSVAALLLPFLRFPRWRYALASWAFFWILSVIFVAWPAVR